jgi:hypothetical protein
MPELLHPRMADVYREKVWNLCSALESEDSRTGAVDAIRALIETILLEPDGHKLKITVKGDLAGMLTAARDSKRSPDTGDLLVQISWLRGPATGATCSCGAARLELFQPANPTVRLGGLYWSIDNESPGGRQEHQARR